MVEIGGVRTLFRMPDLLSIGLGGGTVISGEPLTVGPASVGYRLTEDALVFGGSTLTATDIAVAGGLIELGDPRRVADLDPALVTEAVARMRAMIEEAVDRMKTDAAAVPLIAVGGGAFLVPDRLEGVSEVLRVPHHGVANAVGAAIAQVSGEIDQIFVGLSRDAAIAAGDRAGDGSARSRPGRPPRPSAWSRSRTCRSPICPATASGSTSAWSATSPAPELPSAATRPLGSPAQVGGITPLASTKQP